MRAAYAAALDAWLGALGIDRCHVLGHSLGTLIAAHFAAEQPKRVIMVLHGFAYLMFFRADLASPPDKRMLVLLTGVLAVNGSLMLSQAMELVTRGFYGRGDLDLILSSPVAASRLFVVRIGAMAVTIALTSLALAAPFVNVLAWFGGMRWLSAYAVVPALAMVAVAVAVALGTAGLFRALGPKRPHPRLTARARSPTGQAGKTLCVSPALPTDRRLPTSFTAPHNNTG